MSIEIRKIVTGILDNEKRVAKLETLKEPYLSKKANAYVVAECQTQGIRLSHDDIIKATASIVYTMVA